MSTGGDRQSYLVEWYWPGLTEAVAASTTRRAEAAAGGLAAEGMDISYQAAYIVSDDEVAFCLFEAASMAEVEEACRRAALPFDRILRVTAVSQDTEAGRSG